MNKSKGTPATIQSEKCCIIEESYCLSNIMTLFVNNVEFHLFGGAKAIDAVRAYYRALEHDIPRPLPVIFDNFGNTIEPDGGLSPMQRIYLVEFQNYNDENERF
ncbi:hypothetical protein [Lentimicrobium sp.]|jgi:hypothetical protein|uniref:hypothetical protein n=1 Tax=Lentimicrobium sp. TaxID=2034841 RepID=UPI0025FD03B3|nr:hypothetical protein [Lentimicrobium sp.]MCO5255855.1 hypothetical protein [Lentimicrobium sp.]MCO5261640.1 hypothetical protein [Lentimicrobium sp.]HOP14226.1 hypothetical protein [Lentimicrobium sp.]HPF65057.1 hypothetical protein [Lentimicrobium sp.]HPJ62092.1 hypothetical protein [Lentimicrobium sp.]